jgi:hypothetical protein
VDTGLLEINAMMAQVASQRFCVPIMLNKANNAAAGGQYRTKTGSFNQITMYTLRERGRFTCPVCRVDIPFFLNSVGVSTLQKHAAHVWLVRMKAPIQCSNVDSKPAKDDT